MLIDAQNAAKSSQVYTDMQGLADLKRQARNNADGALVQVAKQFEALFMQMVLKSMRDASIEGGLFDNNQSKMYTDLYDKQLGIKMSESGGLGLADIIVKQMQGFKGLGSNNNDLPMVKPNGLGIANENRSTLDILKDLDLKSAGLTLQPNIVNREQVGLNSLKSLNANPMLKTLLESNAIQQSPQEFVKSIWNQVKSIGKKMGVNPIGILAQTILETGWGKHIAKDKNGNSSNNLFGIKATASWNGNSLSALTQEFRKGQSINLRQEFKAYPSVQESLDDYAKLMQNSPRYEKVIESGTDVDGFAKALQDSGYATDPDYGRKIMRLINSPKFIDVLKDLLS